MNRWTAAGLLGTLLLVPGCGTMGLMTRSSYSTIRDPFLEGSEDPTAGDGGAVVSGDLAGRVAVDADPAGPHRPRGRRGRLHPLVRQQPQRFIRVKGNRARRCCRR